MWINNNEEANLAMAPKLIPLKTVASQMGVSLHTVRRVAAQHGLLIKMGGLRVEAAKLSDLVERCRQPAGQG